jgi:hypothetical protein
MRDLLEPGPNGAPGLFHRPGRRTGGIGGKDWLLETMLMRLRPEVRPSGLLPSALTLI